MHAIDYLETNSTYKDSFRANSLYVKLFKDHIGEDARHRPKHLAPSRPSLFVEL